jgi:hypothetical protein
MIPKKAFSSFCQKIAQAMDAIGMFLPISKSLVYRGCPKM